MAPKVKFQQELPDSEAALDESFYRTFAGPYGEQVLDLLRTVYHDVSSFDADTHMTAYKEGQRSIFLQIQTRIDNYNNRDVRKGK